MAKANNLERRIPEPSPPAANHKAVEGIPF
ncbi:hypothetical protein COLO4_03935 [Corchorus olitorius]|uniref:Uncharacterized protein n=1 Tax=Corchorus olitorius TaxID=93759 RepID=A0A1R3KW05_9ROSI|nr:hypothetical protein COLO4_03935 [Corchorus olitorius]